MNKEEKLAVENKENYELYLKRMTESIKYSTKGFLPFFALGSKKALDVGCGSGVLLKALLDYGVEEVIGIDLNSEAIKRIESINDDRISLYNMSFDEFTKQNISVDTIIFSSVLHEISSYNEDENKRFTLDPIIDAIKTSYSILPKGGKIVIRDCIMVPYEVRNRKVIIKFINSEDAKWLYRFKEEFQGFKGLDVDMNIEELDDNRYRISHIFLKEFLYTYTWGEGSWNREINERVGIMDGNTWEKIVRYSGFEIDSILYSREEYEKYLCSKIEIMWDNNVKYIYPYMNVTIVGVKK